MAGVRVGLGLGGLGAQGMEPGRAARKDLGIPCNDQDVRTKTGGPFHPLVLGAAIIHAAAAAAVGAAADDDDDDDDAADDT